jgi:uncharacterized protein YacL
VNQLLSRFALELNALPKVATNGADSGNVIKNIMQAVFAITAATALLIITLAGIQYIISQGEPQKTAKAKNTIIYALVGLVISLVGASVVTFVLGRLA